MIGATNNPVEPSAEEKLVQIGERPRDPLQEFFARWWRPIGLFVAAVVLVAYAYGVFRQTYEDSMKSAADLFARVRTQYAQLAEARNELRSIPVPAGKVDEKAAAEAATRRGEIEKRIADAQAQLTQSLTALGASREPYPTLGRYYAALGQATDGDLTQLRALRSQLAGVAENAPAAQKFVAEASTIALGRALLDDPKSADEGRNLLMQAVESAGPSAASAAATLALVASGRDQCSAALAVVETFVRKAPEQSELLASGIQRLRTCAESAQ